MMRAVTALAGVALVAVPVAADPRAAYPVAVIGLVCALIIGWPQRGAAAGRRVAAAIRARAWIPARAAAGTVVAVAVIIECAASRLDTVAMAGEGLLLLGFLLLLGRPAGLAGGTTRAWLRLRLPAVLGAVAATGIVLAALAAVPGSSPWLALGGLAAAVAAYLVAAPRDRSGGSPPPG